MSADDFYREYWNAFAKGHSGPQQFTADVPTSKNGQECYRKFAPRWPLGFRLVATANIGDDRIGAEFFTGSNNGRAFLKSLGPSGSAIWLRGGLLAFIHVNRTDGKIELLWKNAGLADRAVWPAHFLWLRIALNELAATLVPKVEAIEMGHS